MPRIAADHPAVVHGRPAILSDDGEALPYPAGVRAVRLALGLSVEALGAACGRSGRTVEDWEQGRRNVPASALLVMAALLAKAAE